MAETIDKPLSRDEAIRRLKVLEPQIRALGITSLQLFGSTARNEARADSDVDLFGEIDEEIVKGWAYFGLSREVGDLLGRKVDFIQRQNLHPMLSADIQASGIRVY